MPPLGVRQNPRGQECAATRRPYEEGMSAGCMEPVVVRLRVLPMVDTGTVNSPARSSRGAIQHRPCSGLRARWRRNCKPFHRPCVRAQERIIFTATLLGKVCFCAFLLPRSGFGPSFLHMCDASGFSGMACYMARSSLASFPREDKMSALRWRTRPVGRLEL